MRSLILPFTIALSLLPATLSAHGVWIAQRADVMTVIYGHGAEDNAYDPAKVTSVTGYTAAGTAKPIAVTPATSNASVMIPEDVVALSVTFDNGFWIKDPAGEWQNVGKQQVAGGTESHQPLKYNTHILAGFDGAMVPTGAKLELLPMSNPTALQPGDDLVVTVLYDGAPLPDVALINDYLNAPQVTTDAKTDADGKITLKVPSAGLSVIGLEYTVKTPDSPDVDEVFYFSTLSFVLPHVE